MIEIIIYSIIAWFLCGFFLSFKFIITSLKMLIFNNKDFVFLIRLGILKGGKNTIFMRSKKWIYMSFLYSSLKYICLGPLNHKRENLILLDKLLMKIFKIEKE